MELSSLCSWLISLEHKVVFTSEIRKKETKAKKKQNKTKGDKVTLYMLLENLVDISRPIP